MPAPIIIGLVGPSGSGKTTVCEYLQQRYGFTRIHVATPLKQGFRGMFGVPARYCEQPLIEEPAAFLGGATPRAVLEHLGTELHQIAPDAIPSTLDRRLTRMRKLAKPWILVDGLRRATEGAVIKRHRGQIIRIIGTEIDWEKPCDVSQADVRADHYVHFAPTKEELHQQLDVVLRQILPPEAVNDRRQ
jgi:hypothetical protein